MSFEIVPCRAEREDAVIAWTVLAWGPVFAQMRATYEAAGFDRGPVARYFKKLD